MKKGFSTGLGAVLLSIIAAGIVTTTSYNYSATSQREVTQAVNVSKYLNGIIARVSDDKGYAISNNTDSDPAKQLEKQQRGTPWLLTPSDKSSSCTTTGSTGCDSIFDASSLKFGTLTSLRHLFTPLGSSCKYHTGTPKSWYSTEVSNENIIPCNLFRVQGPLGTTLMSSDSDAIANNVTTISIESTPSKLDQVDNGVVTTKEIKAISIYIPLQNYLTSLPRKKKALVFLDKLRTEIADRAAITLIKASKSSISKITDISDTISGASPEYGLTPSVILSNECTSDTSKTCYIKVSFITKIHLKATGVGAGEGCVDCLKQDSSNSMLGPITYKDKKSQDLIDTVLLAWETDTAATKKERENPTKAQTVSGISVAQDTISIKISNNEALTINTDATSPDLKFSMQPLEIKTTLSTGTSYQLTKDAFELSVDNTKKIVAGKHNKGTPTQSEAIGLGREINVNKSAKGVLITDGTKSAGFSIADKNIVGMKIDGATHGKGYYYIGNVGTIGAISVTGVLSTTDTKKHAVVDLVFKESMVSGNISGDTSSSSQLILTSNRRLYLRLLTNQSQANINVKSTKNADLSFDKIKEAVSGAIIFYSHKEDNAGKENLSNIIRIGSEGILESDRQRIRINKPLSDFPVSPGDCAYTLNVADCPTKATEFDEFVKEVPNIEKTIDLIKNYTPNKYIAFQTGWLSIESTSDTNSGTGSPSFINVLFRDEVGNVKELDTLPERVRVVIRADRTKCAIPPALQDKDGYFYQEAHSAAPTDDDINHTGSGATYSFNKKSVQIYAPTATNASQSRYLFYTYDGWGSERAKFHCDFGHAKVVVYEPEVTSKEIITLAPGFNIAIKKFYNKTFDYLSTGSREIVRVYLPPGTYFVDTEWNTDYYRGNEQYPEDIDLEVIVPSGMTISDGKHWVFGEFPIRRLHSTTFDTLQVESPGYVIFNMKVDGGGHPDTHFNGIIDINISKLESKV